MPDQEPDASVETPESEAQDGQKEKEAGKSSLEIAFEQSEFIPGQYAPFDYSADEFVWPEDDELRVIRELVLLGSRRDVASRRFEVEQRWEQRLFDRGYQHLLPRNGGGWTLPGEKSYWGVLASSDSAALYATNIMGRDRDILTAAIAREVPKVEFFPKNPDDPASIRASEAANDYKYIYQKNANLRALMMDLAQLYCTDERVCFYTRHVKDKERFGEDETGPRGAEITSVHGVLEHKVPMQAQDEREMDQIHVFDELDIATARATYPWVADKIQPGTPGIGEIELDMIARVNTRLALLGSYVTGDALQRDVTRQRVWLRPQAFFDDTVTKEMREWLLEKFPDGCHVVYCGPQFCFARNEALTDHLFISHALPGIGQNRRSLQASELPIQKRLNAWIDLGDAFIRRTVPRRHYDSSAFDIEALKMQDNTPGKSSPFERQPGVPVDQLIFVEPTPTAQPFLPDFIQSFFGEVPASLVGAVDALFGSPAEDGPTPVGTTQIRRDQALARVGLAWNAAKVGFAVSTAQAVRCCAACQEGSISDFSPEDKRKITINANDLKGDLFSYPEYDAAFPESSVEREARFDKVIDGAGGVAPNPFLASLLKVPKNLRVIADNVRMTEMEIPGEVSIKKQLFELELLAQSAPVDNPDLIEIQQQAELTGVPVDPQTLQGIPQQLPSVPVAQDASEDHQMEAQTCFEWMNDPDEGQKYKNGTAEQQAAYQNVLLHWKAHTDMAAKLSGQAPQVPPRLNIGMKDLPAEGRTQAAAKAGLNIPPQQFKEKDLIDTQHKIHEKAVVKAIPQTYRKVTRNA